MCFKRRKFFVDIALTIINLQSIIALSWLNEYTLVDLELNGTDFVNSETSNWTMSSCYPGNGCVNYYNCSGAYLIGGYEILGVTKGQYFQRIYTGLSNHNQINMQIAIYAIDSWDGGNDHFDFNFDGTSYYGRNPVWQTDMTNNLCGDPTYPDLPIRATLSGPHTGQLSHFR